MLSCIMFECLSLKNGVWFYGSCYLQSLRIHCNIRVCQWTKFPSVPACRRLDAVTHSCAQQKELRATCWINIIVYFQGVTSRPPHLPDPPVCFLTWSWWATPDAFCLSILYVVKYCVGLIITVFLEKYVWKSDAVSYLESRQKYKAFWHTVLPGKQRYFSLQNSKQTGAVLYPGVEFINHCTHTTADDVNYQPAG